MKIIFIGGGSGSGKTTLAKKLVDRLKSMEVSCNSLSMDDYFNEIPEGVDLDYFRNNTNFEQPGVYDSILFSEHLFQLVNGQPITKPIFNFPTNRRLSFETVEPKDFLIIEGVFALKFAKELAFYVDKVTVFVNGSSYLDLVKKRTARDMAERGRTALEVTKQEKKFVGPGFFTFIAHSQSGVDINILNDLQAGKAEHPLDTAVDEVVEYLNMSAEILNKGFEH